MNDQTYQDFNFAADLLGSPNRTNAKPIDSYAVFRELHSPQYVFADAFLIFEKIMDLGIKDLYYIGESMPKLPSLEDIALSASEKQRLRRQHDIKNREYDASRTSLRKRSYKIANHMLR